MPTDNPAAGDALRAMLRGFQGDAEAILDEMSRVDLEHLADCAGELADLAALAAQRKRKVRGFPAGFMEGTDG
jgi:hypothetical protein